MVWLLAAFLALSAVPSSSAGGGMESVLLVGEQGSWAEIKLARTGSKSDVALYRGGRRVRPRGGYVRLYPFFGGLPGAPGRYYPQQAAVCWDSIVLGVRGSCFAGGRRTRELVGKAADRLVKLDRDTTFPVRLVYRSRRIALANVAVALELAFERGPSAESSGPNRTIPLSVHWRGPERRARPRRVRLSPAGFHARGKVYPVPRGVWQFACANLVGSPC